MYHYLVYCPQCSCELELDLQWELRPNDAVLCGDCEDRAERAEEREYFDE